MDKNDRELFKKYKECLQQQETYQTLMVETLNMRIELDKRLKRYAEKLLECEKELNAYN